MNLKNALLLTVLSCAAVACGAPSENAPAADAVDVAPPAATDSPAATASPTASAVADAAPVRAGAGSCPLFCAPKDGACTRPKIADSDLDKLTCGMYSTGGLSHHPREACPAECCPERKTGGGDADADGNLDVNDKCKDAPEDPDGFEDADGCPDPDNDKDGLTDTEDKCCYVAEDKDGKEDLDGCPEK